MRLWALDTINHAAFNKTAKYTSLHAPKYTLKHTPDCTRLYTASLLDGTLPTKLSRRSQVHSEYAPSTARVRSEYAPSTLRVRSEYAPSTLPSTPPCWFSSTLLHMLTRMLPLALDGTQPACLTVHSQTSSQEALKHTPEHALKYTPNCTQ